MREHELLEAAREVVDADNPSLGHQDHKISGPAQSRMWTALERLRAVVELEGESQPLGAVSNERDALIRIANTYGVVGDRDMGRELRKFAEDVLGCTDRDEYERLLQGSPDTREEKA